MKTTRFAAIALISVVAACAGEATEPAPPTEPAATEEGAAPPNADATEDPAVATLLRGGDFPFSLRDSGVLADVRARCETEGETKAAGAARTEHVAACLARISEQAAGEGLLFTPLENGRVHYLSYVHENGKRATHIEAEVSVKAHEPGIVELVDIEVLEGPELPPNARIFLEVVGEDTIAMDKKPSAHPRTGGTRLVFHRSAR